MQCGLALKWYWVVAFGLSVFWGFYGVAHLKFDKKGNNELWEPNYGIQHIGYFLSEFFGSLAGWFIFFVLLNRMGIVKQMDLPATQFGKFELFLFLGAFVGISGWAFVAPKAISEWLGKKR